MANGALDEVALVALVAHAGHGLTEFPASPAAAVPRRAAAAPLANRGAVETMVVSCRRTCTFQAPFRLYAGRVRAKVPEIS